MAIRSQWKLLGTIPNWPAILAKGYVLLICRTVLLCLKGSEWVNLNDKNYKKKPANYVASIIFNFVGEIKKFIKQTDQ